MSEDKKTIQEALAEVQRNAELKRLEEAQKMWEDVENVDEGMARAWQQAANRNPRVQQGIVNAMGKILGSGKTNAAPKAPPKTSVPPFAPTTAAPKPAAPAKVRVDPVARPSQGMGKTALKVGATGAVATALGLAGMAGVDYAKKVAGTEPPKPGDKGVYDPNAPVGDAASKAPETPKALEAPKQTFGQAFAAARKAAAEKGVKSTGQFEYQGKKFQTNIKGEKYVPMSKQTKVGGAAPTTAAPKPVEAPKSNLPPEVTSPKPMGPTQTFTPTTPPTKQSSGDSYVNREPGWPHRFWRSYLWW